MNNKRHSVLLAMSVALALPGCAPESSSDSSGSAEGSDSTRAAGPDQQAPSAGDEVASRGHWPDHGWGTGASTGASTSTSAGAGGAGTGTSTSASSSASTGAGGAGGALGGSGGASCTVFPADNWWNKDISSAAVDAKSAAYVATIGAGTSLHPDFGTQYGIPYVKVNASVPKSTVVFDYASESDVGPYPIPANPPIEGGSDAHILMLHTGECKLYELYAASKSGAQWYAGSGAIWDLTKSSTRPKGWTSADAAGLPIYPGLVRQEEVAAGVINHALRFTAPSTQHGYVAPASHYASSSYDTSRPPMGVRFRLKAGFNISGYSASMKVILTALKKYGMFLADNGGAWYLTGTPSPSWNDNAINTLKQVHGSDFEAIVTGPITTN